MRQNIQLNGVKLGGQYRRNYQFSDNLIIVANMHETISTSQNSQAYPSNFIISHLTSGRVCAGISVQNPDIPNKSGRVSEGFNGWFCPEYIDWSTE